MEMKIKMDMNMNTIHCEKNKKTKMVDGGQVVAHKMFTNSTQKHAHTHLNTLEYTRTHALDLKTNDYK